MGAVGETDDPTTASAPESGRWEFDETVTAAFDDMLQKSIPNYADMRKIVTDAAAWHHDRLAQGYRAPQLIVDIGVSRGAALAPLVDKLGAHARFLGCDVSQPMLAAARERFAGMMEAGIVDIREWDLREGLIPSAQTPAVVLSILTLQFVPIEYRQRLLRDIAENLRSGGCLILVEKVLGANAELDAVEVDLYYGTKREHGYTQEAIDRKRLSLEGVLVPLTARFNEELMREAGFAAVDCIWAWANFRGWIAVKR